MSRQQSNSDAFTVAVFKIDQIDAAFPLTMPDMKSGPLVESQALKFRCPTCGAGPKMKCELATGGVRNQSHLDRRLIAVDKLVAAK
jgi:hypothetical protein